MTLSLLAVGSLARHAGRQLHDVVIVAAAATATATGVQGWRRSSRGVHEHRSSGGGTLSSLGARERVAHALQQRLVGLVHRGLVGHVGLFRRHHLLSLAEMSAQHVARRAATTTNPPATSRAETCQLHAAFGRNADNVRLQRHGSHDRCCCACACACACATGSCSSWVRARCGRGRGGQNGARKQLTRKCRMELQRLWRLGRLTDSVAALHRKERIHTHRRADLLSLLLRLLLLLLSLLLLRCDGLCRGWSRVSIAGVYGEALGSDGGREAATAAPGSTWLGRQGGGGGGGGGGKI